MLEDSLTVFYNIREENLKGVFSSPSNLILANLEIKRV